MRAARRIATAAIAVVVLAVLLGGPGSVAASTDSPIPVSSCTTGEIQSLFADGGDYELDCSGTIDVPIVGAPSPFVLDGQTLTLSVGSGYTVALDGLGQSSVVHVIDGASLTLTGLAINNGQAKNLDGADGTDGGDGSTGPNGDDGLDDSSGQDGYPGQAGSPGGDGDGAADGLDGQGGGMLIDSASSATLTSVTFSGDVAQGGKGGAGGAGGAGGDGGDAGNGGNATSDTGNGGNGGDNGGANNDGAGADGADGGAGGAGGKGEGGAIYNEGTLTITKSSFTDDKATGGSGGSGGKGGTGGKGGGGGVGGEDKGMATDGNGGDAGDGGDGGVGGDGGNGGDASGGAIYSEGNLTIDNKTSFSSDKATAGKGGNGGGNGDGGQGGNGGTDGDKGVADNDTAGTGGNGGNGGNGGTGSGQPGNGGDAAGGAVYSAVTYNVISGPPKFSGDSVTAGNAGFASKAGKGGAGGTGGTGTGGNGMNGNAGQGSSPVSVTVQPGNSDYTDSTPSTGINLPKCEAQSGSVQAGESTSFQLSCSSGGSGGSYEIVSPPQHGRLGQLDPLNGTVTYTADVDLTEPTTDTFKFRFSTDIGIDSKSATVTVSITPAPVVSVTNPTTTTPPTTIPVVTVTAPTTTTNVTVTTPPITTTVTTPTPPPPTTTPSPPTTTPSPPTTTPSPPTCPGTSIQTARAAHVAPTAQSAAACSKAACTQAFFYSVRGSSELPQIGKPAPPADPLGLGAPALALYHDLKQKGGQPLADGANKYSAFGIDEGLVEDVLHFQPPGTVYAASVREGVSRGVEDLTKLARTKTNACFVVVGYSQGADVLRRTLNKLPRSVLAKIAVAILFGDPNFHGKESKVTVEGKAPTGSQGAMWFALNDAHLPSNLQPVPSGMKVLTYSWCRPLDAVCGLTKAIIAGAIIAHDKHKPFNRALFISGHSQYNEDACMVAQEVVDAFKSRGVTIVKRCTKQHKGKGK